MNKEKFEKLKKQEASLEYRLFLVRQKLERYTNANKQKDVPPKKLSLSTPTVFYTDAGTSNNGMIGYQVTRICVARLLQVETEILLEKVIGDFTNNQGEIIAIIEALRIARQRKESVLIKTDSKIAMGWAIKGRTKASPKNENFAMQAHKLLLETCSRIEWVPRDQNAAGHYLEDKYSI